MSAEHDRFERETALYRRALRAYCYRMVGSAHDAEDSVQETYLRAWRGFEAFERRASVRSWLYRIATNVCLDALASRRARVLPSSLGEACDVDRPPTDVADASWLEPVPDAWIEHEPSDPASALVARESVRLALIASLQLLPPRQRAILILREILAFSAEETAEVLAVSVAAVKSGLQRARARIDETKPDREALLEPSDPRAQELLAGYMAAFERADATLLERVLRADATLEATPFRDWQSGRRGCMRLLERYVLGAPGDWKMIATRANGQPAAIVLRRDAEGVLRPDGLVVLAATRAGVSRVVAFHHDPRLVAPFLDAAPSR